MAVRSRKMTDKIPEPTLRRLPWYLSNAKLMKEKGEKYVSSTQISRQINIDASQIAKDLSFLNIKGKTRIGYQVETLATELSNFLGFHNDHTAFMIGAGSLGSALIQDSGLMQFGLHIVAGFDVDEKVVGTEICGIPIYNISELPEREKQYKAEIGGTRPGVGRPACGKRTARHLEFHAVPHQGG